MATYKWITAREGIRYREHPTRKNGVNFDRYYSIRYYDNEGKRHEESLGWASKAGWTTAKANRELMKIRANLTTGTGHQSIRDSRRIEKAQRLEEDRQKRLKQQQENHARDLVITNVFSLYCESSSHKKSLKDEINYFKNWVTPYIGSKRLDEIILLDLERIRKKMTTAGNAPRSIQYVKSIIRQIYHYANTHKIYSGESPTTNFLKKERSDNRRQRYLTPQEGENLLNKVRQYSEKTYQISLLSLHSGMRFGEIASLQWQHVNIENREILVIDPKNGETRSVFMTEKILDMFSKMTKDRRDEIVFPSTNGKKRPRVSKVFAKAVDDLGLNEGITDRRMKVVFHTLRHSCASILVNAGVEIPVIAKILGHKTLAMTMRYSHVSDPSVKKAMAIFNEQVIEPQAKSILAGEKG